MLMHTLHYMPCGSSMQVHRSLCPHNTPFVLSIDHRAFTRVGARNPDRLVVLEQEILIRGFRARVQDGVCCSAGHSASHLLVK